MLPFALEEFVVTSVAPAGGDWVERFERCLGAAETVSYATVDAYLDDDVLYGYCAELAMGLALVRARHLDSDVHQLALWDGEAPTGVAGTAADVARWRTTSHDVIVVAPRARGLPALLRTPAVAVSERRPRRQLIGGTPAV